MLKCYNISMETPTTKPFKTSIDLITEGLVNRGYTLEKLPLGEVTLYAFTAPNGWRWVTRFGSISYPFMPAAVSYIARHKNLAYAYAQSCGVVTPRTLYLPNESEDLEAFVDTFAPVIVKPSAAFGGHGLTMNLTTIPAVKEAARLAQTYAPIAVVQQQFSGEEIRLTVIEGEVVSVLQRETPRVIGDGRSSVAELIQAENNERRKLSNIRVPYPQLDGSIIDASFLTDTRIPVEGETVELGTSSIVAGGAIMRSITDQTHDSYKRLAVLLAKRLGTPFIVVDLLVKDYEAAATQDNYVFLEFNTTPSLRLYYEVRSGQDYDIVNKLVDMIDARSKLA